MNTKLTRYIAILLTCLLISSQAHAQAEPNSGTSMEDAFEVKVQGDHFSYTKSGRYNIGYFSKLFLYYKMNIDRPMMIKLKHYSSVPMMIDILDEQGSFIENEGDASSFSLNPGIYYILLNVRGTDIDITLTVEGISLYENEGNVPETPVNYTPSQNMNYIRTITPTVGTDEANSLYYLSKAKHHIRYFDYLGRLAQEMGYKSSPDRKDVAIFHEYDALGRSSKQWLPVMRLTPQSSGTFIPKNIVEKNAKDLYSDQAAFSYPVYEAS